VSEGAIILKLVGEWSGEQDGLAWSTDGLCIVVAEGRLPEGSTPKSPPGKGGQPADIWKTVRAVLALPDIGEDVDTHRLAEFSGGKCATCDGGRRLPLCDECRGNGWVIRDCEFCDHDHRCPCDCNGGKTDCPDCGFLKAVRVAGAVVDWRLLRKVLASCPTDTCRISGIRAGDTGSVDDADEIGLAVFGTAWRAYIMPVDTGAVVEFR
jgi:hypothetical protein